MSTRASIVYGEGIHFFKEMMDEDDSFYLTMSGPDVWYEASPEEITVRIPPHIWEVIRGHKSRLDLVSLSDEDLRFMVETEVDKRIKDYEAAESKSQRALLAFFGSLIYGGANEDRDAQIQAGLAYYTRERARQLEVVEKMKAFKTINRDDE